MVAHPASAGGQNPAYRPSDAASTDPCLRFPVGGLCRQRCPLRDDRPTGAFPAGGATAPSVRPCACACATGTAARRSEEHTSELQSLMRISYAVFCLKKKNKQK